MERYEVIETGEIVEGNPFTDFDELDEMDTILTDSQLSPDYQFSGRGGYHVYNIQYQGEPYTLHLYLKKITFGGREHRPREKRAQFSAALDRRGYEAKDLPANLSLIVGIYKYSAGSRPIICTWRIDDWGLNIGRAFNCFTDVRNISESYTHIIAQHKTAAGQLVCALRPEYFQTYLRFRSIVHIQLVDNEDLLGEIPDAIPIDQSNISEEIPKMEDLFETIISVLRENQGIANIRTIEFEVAEKLELSDQARQQIHNPEEGDRTELGYRLAWARHRLKHSGLIDNPKREIWRLTELGHHAQSIDKDYIKGLGSGSANAINEETVSEKDGIEQEIGSDLNKIASPFDPNLVDIRTRSMSLDLILKRLSRQSINLETRFQRKAGLWTLAQQSRLIESILVKIPLPVFYFDGSDDDNWLVVDGLQRLSTLDAFVNKESFRLTNLEFLDKFNGMLFSQLPAYLQRRIEEFEITAYIIAPGTPKNLQFNVFKRINTGGLTLSSQEIRNALNQGTAADFVQQLASLPSFKVATDFSISEDRMLDREFVNRFLAFYLFPIAEYQSDLEDFLNRALEYLEGYTANELDLIAQAFNQAMETAFAIFGVHAFRKSPSSNNGQKPINKALFEVWSVLLSRLSPVQAAALIQNRERVRSDFTQMEQDEEFRKSISSSTTDKARVRTRFACISTIIENTFIQS